MTYRVILLPRASSDLEKVYLWGAQFAPETAARWLSRFYTALRTLAENPQRCGIVAESELVGREIRQFLFGKRKNVWRALFLIQDNEVRVLHIRRASMNTATRGELTD